MKEDSQKPLGDSFVHSPLPYLVTVKSTVDDDSVPSVQVVSVTAYCLFEAMFQAITQVGGKGFDDERHRVEAIGPDVAAFVAMSLKGELPPERAKAKR